jgi:cell division protease FtsH
VVRDPWLPVGLKLPNGSGLRAAVTEGEGWQLYEVAGNGRAIVVEEPLAQRWLKAGLLAEGALVPLRFGNQELRLAQSSARHVLVPIAEAVSPSSQIEAMAFAVAMRETRKIAADASLHDAIYVERYSRLLPTWSETEPKSDDLVLGMWLSGGARISARSFSRLSALLSWLPPKGLRAVIEAAGLNVTEEPGGVPVRVGLDVTEPVSGIGAPPAISPGAKGPFRLAGRPELQRFFQEHVVDIVQNAESYRALGIEFPSPIALHGPPGCGKTFAVERLVEYLDWPSFSIDSNSIGSPYIHETGKKIAKAFDDAMKASPALVVIDEMDAFLSDRQLSGGQGLHHVEEVAEFLRRIPEAIKNHVLLIGMTNRIEMIDAAILRRGRFDHVIHVGMPSAEEVRALVDALLRDRPCADDVDREALVEALIGRPLSDVAFVVRESARLAARGGQKVISQRSLMEALQLLPAKVESSPSSKPIGFRPV